MDRPVAIEVRNLTKSFHIQGQRLSGLGARRKNLSGREPGRELEVLRDLSFEVGRGEFFGIVGRNGSGKSTLLKLLASVYKADSGRIRIAGRLAPFLELGIGFNPELTAKDNVVLNGVMMGLGPAEARRRFDEIIEFAGLEDYTDLRIRNYSSGMKVRLGFAVMTHVDADLLLVDEVLAVGDADFQAKCVESFEEMHRAGRTILLVTHSMPTVINLCERALLLDNGVIDTIGSADLVSQRYFEVNLTPELIASEGVPAIAASIFDAIANPRARIVDARVISSAGMELATLATGDPIHVQATVQIDPELDDGALRVEIASLDGHTVFSSKPAPFGARKTQQDLVVRVAIENRLPAGRYRIILDSLDANEHPVGPTRTIWVTITGESSSGAILLDHEITFNEAIGAVR